MQTIWAGDSLNPRPGYDLIRNSGLADAVDWVRATCSKQLADVSMLYYTPCWPSLARPRCRISGRNRDGTFGHGMLTARFNHSERDKKVIEDEKTKSTNMHPNINFCPMWLI
ncbi:hypothetical protein M0657_007854 [Pyricularia oryzae]|nr:hypothetical protein M9X92_007565 [Pyricularia oryzae]KAI7917937.1 hypothetical protein M0657_007854 [Pyricularia oryzae]